MKLLKFATLGLFLVLGSIGACGSSGSPSGGTGGTSGGTGGSGTAWNCSGSPCVCHLQTGGGTTTDTCTNKANCCMESAVEGDTIDSCVCNNLTGSSMTCAQFASSAHATVVTTCPPP